MKRYKAVANIGLTPTGHPLFPAGSYLPEDYPYLERLMALGAVVVEEVDEPDGGKPQPAPQGGEEAQPERRRKR